MQSATRPTACGRPCWSAPGPCAPAAVLASGSRRSRRFDRPQESGSPRSCATRPWPPLTLPDLEVAREWDGYPEGTTDLAFDAAFERYVRIDKSGELTVCRLTPAGEEVFAHLPAYGQRPYHGLWL